MSLTLYYHPLASFCHKVLIALYENGTEFERRIIDLGDAADSAELLALWPIGKFPVIRDPVHQRNLPESSIIIEYLDRQYPGKHRLVPDDWDSALEVRLWDRFFDHYVQVPMQQIVSDRLHATNGDLSRERATLETAYGMLDRRMASRIWVASPAFSMADCAAAPALFYARTLVPFPDDYRHLSAYFERLVQRPSFQRVIDEARPWFSYYPFAEAIEQRFLAPDNT
ncbi:MULTISPECIES: glutathione S-transferase family protein [Pseudomonas]|uniref:Glutathione S-transferase n=1 Tax=Pseudomonas lini TaxID=163011 RepID=A0A0J6HLH0_9PSED|nr:MULTISPECIES: glutathione S-transferase family protein [Pseudomonas]KAB0507394.1 glutathione S-transferase family protein [Pseudomonas lini]KMM95328.1 glutathione S-transferase [Pseudomonas lini]MDT9673406.1 glutathione S-transferase family protein [Pseudomonas sp. JV414]NSX07076.1 glutathione S-transferase family protein [Pseudomonas lini]SDT33905.1 glutathione S-transferase [Pseudomonas lini]